MTTPESTVPIQFEPAHGNFEAFTDASSRPDGSASHASKVAVLTRFAEDNGLTYTPCSLAPTYPGYIFTPTNAGVAVGYDRLTTPHGRRVDFGNFEPHSEQDLEPGGHIDPPAPEYMWGFVALQMDRQLPNMMLISKRRIAGEIVLPFVPARSQILKLEGNFDEYFTLYCPKEFEQDALYIFTPDLMALLIDEVAPLDVEIVDSWMFLYAPHPFDSLDPNVYRRIFRILDTVGTKIVGQTTFFSDPQLGPMPNESPKPGWHFTPNPAMFGDHSPTGTRLKPKSQLPWLIFGLGLVGLFGWFILANLLAGHAHVH